MPTRPGNADHRPRAVLVALGAHALALAAGLGARVGPDGASWFGVRGPQCPVGACLGPLACPGCGLVRATASALQGDLGAALAAHPAGPVVAVLLLASTVLHADRLRAGAPTVPHDALRRLGRRVLAAAILGGWLLRLAVST